MNTKNPKHPVLAALLCMIIALVSFQPVQAQAPNAIPYQGVARNATGAILPNQLIGLRFRILDGSAGGPVVFSETFTTTTTILGLFNINIGTGTPGVGTLAAVNWGSGAKFLQVELDPAGGTTYINMGTTQLMSVPYALQALTASGAPPTGVAGGDLSGSYPNPAIANNAVTTVKIADGNVTDAKIATVSGSKVTGDIPGNAANVNGTVAVANGGTGAITAPAARTNLGLGNVDNTSDLNKPISTATQTALDLKEDLVNKSTTTTLGTSNTLYPTQNAVKTYVDNQITGSATPDATTLVKGKVQLAGDLTGTAASPTIANNAVTTVKIADGNVTDAKIAAVSGSKVTGNISGNAANVTGTVAVANGGTGNTTLTAGTFLTGNGTASVVTTKLVPSGNVLGTTDAQTLTNKTLTDNTNNVKARELWIGSGAGSVSTYAAPAPTTGQVLTATSATTASWQTPTTTTNKVSIRVKYVFGVNTTNIAPRSSLPILWQTVVNEEGGSNYNPATGEYTVPVTGLYHINAQYTYTRFNSAIPCCYAGTLIDVNGVSVSGSLANISPENWWSTTHITDVLQLNAGDIIRIRAQNETDYNITIQNTNNGGFFTVYLIH